MQTIVYLCRHGEVENPKKLWYGHLPGFGLSQRGIEQAVNLAHSLKSKPIAAIYSSPLQRTLETAQIIARQFPTLSVITDERLKDTYSPTQGMTIKAMDAIGWNYFRKEFLSAGGERLRDISIRTNRVLADIVKKNRGKHIVVVSHGDPIMCIRMKFEHRRLNLAHLHDPTRYLPTGRALRVQYDDIGKIHVLEQL